MKAIWMLGALLLASGCDRQADGQGAPPPHHGRYAGIGVFDAGTLWSRADIGRKKGDSAAANLSDDEHVIVVVDTDTGEVRECGDHSGECFAMNPWTVAGRQLPARLTAHRVELQAEAAADHPPRRR
jgi:hypothetical protein